MPFRLDDWAAPKRREWFIGACVVVAVAFGLFLIRVFENGWSSSDWWGWSFGIAAALLLGLDDLYAMRRRFGAWPFGRAQTWLQAHIYGGVVSFALVLMHEGFRWPSGLMGWSLLVLSAVTTIAGLVGVYLQKSVPRALTTGLPVEAIYERIPDAVSQLCVAAERAVGGGSVALQQFYDGDLRRSLERFAPSWSYVFDIRSGREDTVAVFERLKPFLAEADAVRASDLQGIVLRKRDLEAHYSLQRALRLWLVIHVPSSMLLTALVVSHIAAVLRY